MRFLRQAGAAIGLSLLASMASATPANPQNEVDYLTLPEVQQTDSGNKVEVVEFFSYACPHCNAFEPSLAQWVKKQNGRVAFKRVPLAFHAQWVPLQKMYYALEALGKADELHAKVFNAVHGDRMRFENDDAVADIAVKIGLDRKQFLDVYKSFSVQTKVRRAGQLQDDYKITGVPMLAVDGRYETSPGILADHGLQQSESQLFTSTLQVADFLVDKAGKK
jgi:thiol:disulfide interchange protein DsbA